MIELCLNTALNQHRHTTRVGYMQACTSLQTDNHASTPPLSFFTGWMPFLPPNQQRQSTELAPTYVLTRTVYCISSGYACQPQTLLSRTLSADDSPTGVLCTSFTTAQSSRQLSRRETGRNWCSMLWRNTQIERQVLKIGMAISQRDELLG